MTSLESTFEKPCCLVCGSTADLSDPRPGKVCVCLGSGQGKDVIRLAAIVGPGGRFVVSDIYSEEPVSPAYRQDPTAVSKSRVGVMTKEGYLSTLHRAGFTHITIIEESVPYSYACAGEKILVSSFMAAGKRPGGFGHHGDLE